MQNTNSASVQPQPEKRMSLGEIRSRMVGEGEVNQIPKLQPPERKGKGFTVFSPSGRLNRLKYIYFMALNTIGLALAIACMSASPLVSAGLSAVLFVASLVLAVMLAVVRLLTVVKRFHDFGQDWTRLFWLMIPFVDLVWEFKLLFEESDPGDNGYGGLERNSWYWQVPVVALIPPGLLFLAFLPMF